MNTTLSGFSSSSWRSRLARNPADESAGSPGAESSAGGQQSVPRTIRIILADSEAIFRVGMSKIFALQDDLQVVAQTETLTHTLNAVATTPADVILFESGLSPNPADAISEVARRALPGAKLVLVTQRAGEQETVDYLRRW